MTIRRMLPVFLLVFAAACSGQPATTGKIEAGPNPVPGGPGWGTTTVTWSTSDRSWAQVYLAVEGKPETLFTEGPSGSVPAPWIGAGPVYEFRLYAGKDHKKVLSSVKVTRGGS